MSTHYVPIYAKFCGVRERAICGEFVFPHKHSSAPTCPHCHALLMKDDEQRNPAEVSIGEVVERY